MNITITLTVILAAAFLHLLYWLFEGGGWRSHNPICPFLRVIIRVFFRTITLALTIAFGVFLLFGFCYVALGAAADSGPRSHASPSGGGQQSEKFYRFVNSLTAPVQAIWEGFITLLGTIALLVLIFVERAARWVKDNQLLSVTVAGLAFLVWLGFTICDVWTDEFRPRFDPTLRERVLHGAEVEPHRDSDDRHGSRTE